MLRPLIPKYAVRVVMGSDASTSVQVPGPTPSVVAVTHWTSGPEFQLPRTVTPFTRLCFESCAVTRTFADHVSTPLVTKPSRLPTCTLGGLTVIAIARALLLEFGSGDFCVAVRMWRVFSAPVVFQLIVRVALAPVA